MSNKDKNKNPSSSHYTQKEEFIRTYYSEIQASMRYRSENEYRVVRLAITVTPIFLTSSVALNEFVTEPFVYLILNIGLGLSIIAYTLIGHLKINNDHNFYSDLGQSSVGIWKIYGILEPEKAKKKDSQSFFIPKHAKDYGQGKGYRITQSFLWVTSLIGIIILTTLSILKF
ncbi:MAG: hypothetical protein JXR11_12655 [Balneola sp.]